MIDLGEQFTIYSVTITTPQPDGKVHILLSLIHPPKITTNVYPRKLLVFLVVQLSLYLSIPASCDEPADFEVLVSEESDLVGNSNGIVNDNILAVCIIGSTPHPSFLI